MFIDSSALIVSYSEICGNVQFAVFYLFTDASSYSKFLTLLCRLCCSFSAWSIAFQWYFICCQCCAVVLLAWACCFSFCSISIFWLLFVYLYVNTDDRVASYIFFLFLFKGFQQAERCLPPSHDDPASFHNIFDHQGYISDPSAEYPVHIPKYDRSFGAFIFPLFIFPKTITADLLSTTSQVSCVNQTRIIRNIINLSIASRLIFSCWQ